MSTLRWRKAATAGAIIAFGAAALVPSAAPASAETVKSQTQADAEWAEIRAYVRENPEDFAVLERLTKKYTGRGLKVAINGVDEPVSGAEAQEIVDERAELPEGAIPQSKEFDVNSVPVDAFTVTFAFLPRPAPEPYTNVGYGTWNFRDDYVNGSAPDDFASIRIAENSCLLLGDTYGASYFYDDTEAPADTMYLQDAGVNTRAPIMGLRDATSGFMLNVDHGWVMTDLWLGCGPAPAWQGAFDYEHNQDGGSVVSVSASWLGLNVSYGSVGSTLKKSSGIVTG